MTKTDIGFLIYPGMTPLDFVGPVQVFAQIPEAELHYAWKSLEPVMGDSGFSVKPTVDFKSAPQFSLVCIPGGTGQQGIMNDQAVLDFVAAQGAGADYVTSVCSGSLLLAKAGLLDGYRATSHWGLVDDLAKFGAIPTPERVVFDRNRITGAGVTSGIDFGLAVVAKLLGDDVARTIQLAIDYDPAPPFDSGSPDKAAPEAVELLRSALKAMLPV